ncbi:MAG TPA: hypothetical protein PKC96_06055 [Bacilli bacterium]|nr:hypothetical protein [Bacilli bacterium]
MHQYSNNNENIYLRDAKQEDIEGKLSEALNISPDDSSKLLNAIAALKPSSKCYSEKNTHSGFKEGTSRLVVMLGKYSININKIASICLAFLLGISPLAVVASAIKNYHELKKAIYELSNTERMVYIFLKEFSNNGEIELETHNIYDCLLNNKKDDLSVFKSEEEVFGTIDQLAKKDLVEIKTRTVMVKC